MKLLFVFLFCCSAAILFGQTGFPKIDKAIADGEFSEAEKLIDKKLDDENISPTQRLDLEFKLERMDRIRKDFRKTEKDVLEYIHTYYPEADAKSLDIWEKEGSLEYKVIDGKKYYFNRAPANLFRISKEAKKKKIEKEGEIVDKLDEFLEGYLPGVVEDLKESGEAFGSPVGVDIVYTLTVDADAVPAGETVRAWLPYPREAEDRQRDIELVSVENDEYIIAANKNLQRSIYMEKKAVEGEPTVFEYHVKYNSFNEWHDIDPAKVKPFDKNSELYKKYTSEKEPHILFTDKVKDLSKKIVGDETNPYLKAKKIFTWISNNIPWAGAREYSTIDNISDYCIRSGHGDCGIKTILFLTLARYNGIPARWQSGWMLQPGSLNLHDWGQFYLEGYGWMPVDQSFGLVNSDNEDVKYFFLGGLDAYRFVVNDEFSEPFFPAKIHPRSETVDFQRGEVEWKGGNLYFDQWDYHLELKTSD